MILKIIYYLKKICFKLLNLFGSHNIYHFENEQNTINYLVKYRKSLIRWGDGETTIAMGGDIYFQRNNFKLFYEIRKILRNHDKKKSYVLAIPNRINKKSKKWDKTKILLSTLTCLHKNKYNHSSGIFREKTKLKNSEIELLWREEKSIIFVHSNYKYYYDFKLKYDNIKSYFVQVYSSNSFKIKNKIINEIYKIIKENSLDLDYLTIIICSGPLSKVLCYELSLNGLRCLDMGHYFDYKFYNLKRENKEF